MNVMRRQKDYKTVYTTIAITLFVIVAGQVYWIVNMYDTLQKEVVREVNSRFEQAVYMEVTERSEIAGGFSSIGLFSEKGDTSRFIKKEIRHADTTFTATVDRWDPNANLKIIQYIHKLYNEPLNVSRLNEFFYQEMQKSGFRIERTYVEYYDLEKNLLVETSPTALHKSSDLSSNMLTIDIMESMGVKAYVGNPVFVILRDMIVQLILSVFFILIAAVGFFRLRHIIFRQWREEDMRRNSVNSMIHEFKRPISAAIGFVGLIADYIKEGDADEALYFVTRTLEELEKLTLYTERIKQISNDDETTVQLKKTEINVCSFMESVVEKYSQPQNVSDLTVFADAVKIDPIICPEDCPVISADRLHFANVIENLIENAIKYSDNAPHIMISIACQEGYLRIAIKDNGIGISALDQRLIFGRFYRGDSRTVVQKAGVGLGLTYVESIVKAHGGRVEAHSPGVGQGSEFVVSMPINTNDIS